MINNENISDVIDFLTYPILILDQDGTLLVINKAAASLLDQPITPGIPIWETSWWINPVSAKEKWRNACQSAKTGNQLKLVETVFVSANDKAEIIFSLSPRKNREGKITQLFVELNVVELNVVELHGSTTTAKAEMPADALPKINDSEKNREDALLEIERKYRLMVESIEDYAMFMVDLEGFITSWNRGAERLTGYSDIEAIGRHFSMLYHPEFQNKDHAAYELAMAQANGRHEEEGIRVRKDGTQYHAQIIVWRIEDVVGNTVGYAKITRDITERKNTEYALKQSEARFRTMTDAMPQIAWSALPDGKNDYVNRQWHQFFGTNNKAATDENWFDYIHPDEKEKISETWQYCVKNGENFEAQFRLRHFSGDYRWTLGRALPVLTDGKVTRWMGTLTDIHEQKRAEESLHESVRRKDDYLAMLAHELRNPLTPIRNCTLLLRKATGDNAETSKFIDVIDRQIMHMTRLIDDLLDVARISRGKIELRRETFEFSELINNITHDFKTEYDIKKIKLDVEIPHHPIWIHADYTRISQAIGNLLHNSLKFTEAGGQVSISLSEEIQKDKAFGVVKVKDTGAGIDPKLLTQLFEPFVQGDQDLARTKGGLGLGLALIKGFANLHGGHIQVQSAGLGHGAEFIFSIPLSTAPKAKQFTSSIDKKNASLNIVLIDDNQDIAESLASLLSLEGHSVKCAYDGASGLQMVKSGKPDLVFCDIGLPGELDGYNVARSVRADNTIKDTFMVALTGYGQERDRKLAFESGFNDHLLKPVDYKTLFTIVNQLTVTVDA